MRCRKKRRDEGSSSNSANVVVDIRSRNIRRVEEMTGAADYVGLVIEADNDVGLAEQLLDDDEFTSSACGQALYQRNRRGLISGVENQISDNRKNSLLFTLDVVKKVELSLIY